MTGGAGAHADVAHGWTLADVDQLARSAAGSNYTMAADFSDLHHAAFSGIVDALLVAEQPPARYDLAYAGKAAIWGLVRDHRQTYGYRDRDPWNGLGSAPMFAAYWNVTRSWDSPFEDELLERLALTEVWVLLSDRDRTVLTALAVHDDYRDAAAALGMPDSSYRTYVSLARRSLLALWHDWETPRKQTGYNRRRHRVELKPCPSLAAYYRHKKYGEPVDDGCAQVAREYERARKMRAA